VLEAITAAGAAEVIVLPNDRDSVARAEARPAPREETDVRVAVIADHAQVQGLAALAVHEPGRAFEQDILEMTAAARHARSGAVTVAAAGDDHGRPCEPGDVLGAIEGDFVVVGDDSSRSRPSPRAAARRWRRAGHAGGRAEAGDLADRVRGARRGTPPDVDVVVYDGGQPRYPLLVGVE
jgi:dihydroxyacetone kinase-like predicted kinase